MPTPLSLASLATPEPVSPSSHTDEVETPISDVEAFDAIDSAPASGVQLSPRRVSARAWVANAFELARAATRTSQEMLARAIGVKKTQVARWGDEASGKAIALGDVVAAADSGRREWAATLLVLALDRVNSARAPVSAEQQAWRVASDATALVGSLLAKLEDGVLTREEMRELAPELRALGRGVEALLRAVEQAR